jgi:Cold shock proteins
MEGTIKWYNCENGYGFIRGENGENIFFRFPNKVDLSLCKYNDGDKVEFILDSDDNGLIAKNVRKIQ